MPVVDSDPTTQRALGYPPRRVVPPAAAKLRILATADRLFYDEGIRSVGIDRLISESEVTKATFYKHYGSKDRLILEYVKSRHRAEVAVTEQVIDQAQTPKDAVQALVAALVADIQRPDFRGCAFINAAAEFGDEGHPVRETVNEHRDWYTDTLAALFSRLGHPLPGDAADDFILARDGAMAGGYAGDAIAASTALQRASVRILDI
ncbi:TetR/AcrR family transcriptional regulator [Lacisediminihabitans changchengi]|uniref:TetR/AcrR family transcriptional regulator n=1 Tax=Lacisediminihabitans changchengi TaxID=2787634 RepID=A0A934SLK9_9MICO|nr:TetR/AcrR family transcriptional regulator [Lacisediminihabitans changchengi]MBK4347590.1 TetR/AcrR family transcriptional regulator [Lacisediminihabitans changchengi]